MTNLYMDKKKNKYIKCYLDYLATWNINYENCLIRDH